MTRPAHLVGIVAIPLVDRLRDWHDQFRSITAYLADRWRASYIRYALRSSVIDLAARAGLTWRPRSLDKPPRKVRARPTLTGIEDDNRLPQLNRSVRALSLLAVEQLQQIRFLQTHTSGWSGKIDAPKSVGWTVTRSLAHAEQPLTQPEVVAALREFLDIASTVLIRAGEASGITIAIDELNKFADPAQAHEFVNEIKAVFGVHDCVFLVSASDDALAAFERRGIPLRDALDSAFTAMIAVDAFTFAESSQWLDRQLIGLPTPYAALCHCLSGGIPRELARAAASLDDLYRSRHGSVLQLTEVTHRIVSADVAAKLRAFTHAAATLPTSAPASQFVITINTVGDLIQPDTNQLATRLHLLASTLAPSPARSNGTFRPDSDTDAAGPQQATDLERLHAEVTGHCLLSATLCELFTDELTETSFQQLTTPHTALPLDILASARQALAVEPRLATAMITRFRDRYLDLSDPTTQPS